MKRRNLSVPDTTRTPSPVRIRPPLKALSTRMKSSTLKRGLVVPAGAAIVGVILSLALRDRAISHTPNPRLVARLGGRFIRRYKDYDPVSATPEERSAVDASRTCVVQSKTLTAEGMEQSKKLIRYDAARKVWTVLYFHESEMEPELDCGTILFVEVDQRLNCLPIKIIDW